MVTLVSQTRSKECKLCIGQRDFKYFAFQSDKLGNILLDGGYSAVGLGLVSGRRVTVRIAD